MKAAVQQVMEDSGVGFGTSGARGLADQMTDRICWIYTRGFLGYLEEIGDIQPGADVALAGDLRPSTGRILDAIADAVRCAGYNPIDCGRIPSPTVALYGLKHRIASITVTGSHIPADRNGIKFNKPAGEILKEDEEGIRRQVVESPDERFSASGALRETAVGNGLKSDNSDAASQYVTRYLDFFQTDPLSGMSIGVYEHSAVGRDLLTDILQRLGARVVCLGRSDSFVPVDTEAIRPEDTALALQWSGEFGLDAIVSTDGDSDRPLVADENGQWLRGDIAGILCARFLCADSVSVPVSCNSAVEMCHWFEQVRRTRIGSPWVIASMNAAVADGARRVVGYEANGGFLINTPLTRNNRSLAPLPTRDAVIVILSILVSAAEQKTTVSGLLKALPTRFTSSDRLKEFPIQKSRALMAMFDTGDEATDRLRVEQFFGSLIGTIDHLSRTDGLRVVSTGGEVIHLRPSGNAPEFRCYTEASTNERAMALNNRSLEILKKIEVA